MAAGPLLPQAVEDLAGLPRNAHERAVADQILLNLQHALGSKASRTPEEQEFITTMFKTWDDARDESRIETRAADLLTVLRVRGLAVSAAARKRILAQKDPERLKRWLEKAVVAASVAEVLAEPS